MPPFLFNEKLFYYKTTIFFLSEQITLRILSEERYVGFPPLLNFSTLRLERIIPTNASFPLAVTSAPENPAVLKPSIVSQFPKNS